jgi:phi LC3 family holin
MSNRFKNAGLWLSLVGLVFLFLQTIGVDVSLSQQEAINRFVDAIVGVLVVAGILNNPTTDNMGFFDDKQEGE